MEIGEVIGPLCSPRELMRLLLYGLELVGVRAPAPPSLFDTSPQPDSITALIDFEQLAANVENRILDTAAVVATDYATARSIVFHSGGASPPPDNQRGIDYVATRLGVEHVQASAAIQSLFPAVRVDQRWYGDGGVRLNTPLKPALELDAARLLVIGLNSVAGPPSSTSIAARTSSMAPRRSPSHCSPTSSRTTSTRWPRSTTTSGRAATRSSTSS